MGCGASKDGKAGKGKEETEDFEATHVAKQNVTLWTYGNGGNTAVSAPILEGDLVEVLISGPKWWQVKAKAKDGIHIGYASKYYFAPRSSLVAHGQEPWYFGDMDRSAAQELLGDTANPDGSFLVRSSTGKGKGMDVLSLKYFDTQPKRGQAASYAYKNYDVKGLGSGEVWFTPQNKFSSLTELIKFCSDNKAPGVKTKLTNICLIPNPHADKTFEYWNEMQDSLRVPLTEITWEEPKKILGSGQFGEVFAATFRGNLKVAVKQLKVKEAKPGEAEKAIEEFFAEISAMRGLNHPNLVQLFAFVTSNTDGNYMIQEFMANGDLKTWLKKVKEGKGVMGLQDGRLWPCLLAWCVEIARGMERLESLGIVHRDLAARNVLLDQFSRAKVADFGLALTGEKQVKAELLPVKWTSPESIFKQQFTSMSDVWSYGILMFEVFSVGENPYHFNKPKVNNKDYKIKIKKEWSSFRDTGVKPTFETLRCRMGKEVKDYFQVSPDIFQAVIEAMQSCWDIEPKDRTSFRDIVTTLEGLKNDYDTPYEYTE